ncbi:hypothetical protein PC116_g4914 [Phytophthora cactorum]|uniref:Uncharacterized protein n=1 Tax=Phytophthora cactorum TaxID=29920 RepID=A0A8T1LHD9_9STRA|nr:hypothetical protein PC118_g1876 [Phytophthora cactorum]KAG4247359.1 hypothetical protein PC116_g4914 [Phytophthora cactorum]
MQPRCLNCCTTSVVRSGSGGNTPRQHLCLRSPRGYAVSDATWNSPLKARFKARWVDHLREQLLTRDTASKFKIKPSTRPTKLHLELFRALDDFAGPMSGEITPKKQH